MQRSALVLTGLMSWPIASAAAAVADPLAWLLLPLSGASEHHISSWAAWHARLMVLAWAMLLPLGALAARFYKVMPGQDWPRELDNKAWWHAHRLLQWAGVAAPAHRPRRRCMPRSAGQCASPAGRLQLAKRRGFCPSCGARRMAQTAAHLVDHVIPHVPVRQWVVLLPIPLRLASWPHNPSW